MIKALDAVVADGAVGATRRSVKHARVAVFHSNGNAVDDDFFRPRDLNAWCLSSVC